MDRCLTFTALVIFIIQLDASPNKDQIDSLNKKAGRYIRIDYDSAVLMAELAYKDASQINYVYGVAKSLSIQARSIDLKGLHNSAHLLYMEALYQFKTSDTLDYFNEFSVLHNIGRTHHLFKQYQGAIDYYDSALQVLNSYISRYPDMAVEYGDDKLVAVVMFDKAINLFEIGKSDDAQALFQKAEERAWDEENYNLIANIRNELGLIFIEAGHFEKAREFYFPVLSYNELDTVTRARILHNIGTSFMKEGSLEKAGDYYEQAIAFNTSFVDQRDHFLSLLFLGETHLKAGKIDRAIEAWEQGLELSYFIDNNPEHFVIYQYLRDVHYDLNNRASFVEYRNAYDFAVSSYMEMQKKILEDDQILRFEILTDVYYERKRQLEENNQLYMYLMVVVPSVFIIGFLSVLYVRKRYKAKLDETSDEILSVLGD